MSQIPRKLTEAHEMLLGKLIPFISVKVKPKLPLVSVTALSEYGQQHSWRAGSRGRDHKSTLAVPPDSSQEINGSIVLKVL